MRYKVFFTEFFKKQLNKIKRKDKHLFNRLTKKITEIQDYPEHYKPLRNELKGNRRAHLGPFVIVFGIKEDLIIFHYVKHHNNAY